MEGDVIGLAALDLVSRCIHAGVVGVAIDIEIAGMNPRHRATNSPSLGIPAHMIANVEAPSHHSLVRFLATTKTMDGTGPALEPPRPHSTQ